MLKCTIVLLNGNTHSVSFIKISYLFIFFSFENKGLAKQYMNKDEVTRLYSSQAKELEVKGRYKEAEKLYITINDNAAAILMYKRTKNYDALIRLVRQYYPDKMKDTEITIAKELEQEKRYKEAEMHYVQAGDWKSAANMYRLLENWDDAYRKYDLISFNLIIDFCFMKRYCTTTWRSSTSSASRILLG